MVSGSGEAERKRQDDRCKVVGGCEPGRRAGMFHFIFHFISLIFIFSAFIEI